MVPQTIVGFWFFLLLVAPGLTYQLMRERTTPATARTAFREASVIALSSFAFSLVSFCGLIAVRLMKPSWVFDLGAYLNDPKYVHSHYSIFIANAVVGVLVALGLAVFSVWAPGVVGSRIKPETAKKYHLPQWIWRKPANPLSRLSALWLVLVKDRDDDQTAYVSLRLSDGSRIAGYLKHFTDDSNIDNQVIALMPPTNGTIVVDEADNERKLARQDSSDWNIVWVRVNDVVYGKVEYVSSAPVPSTSNVPVATANSPTVATGLAAVPAPPPSAPVSGPAIGAGVGMLEGEHSNEDGEDDPSKVTTITGLSTPIKDPRPDHFDATRTLGLPLFSGRISEQTARHLVASGEVRLRAYDDEMVEEGLDVHERAARLVALRLVLRAWAHDRMSRIGRAAWPEITEPRPTFEQLVAQLTADGIAGDDIYQRIIDDHR